MKRVYKIVIQIAEEPDRVVVLESQVLTHAETPSPLYSGRISVLKDGTFRIWDYYPQVNVEQSSDDWEEYFSVKALTPVAQVKAIQGHEAFIYKSIVDDEHKKES